MGGLGAGVVDLSVDGGIGLHLIAFFVVCLDYVLEFGEGYIHEGELAPAQLSILASANEDFFLEAFNKEMIGKTDRCLSDSFEVYQLDGRKRSTRIILTSSMLYTKTNRNIDLDNTLRAKLDTQRPS